MLSAEKIVVFHSDKTSWNEVAPNSSLVHLICCLEPVEKLEHLVPALSCQYSEQLDHNKRSCES